MATLGLGVYLFLAVNSTPSASALPTPVEHHDEPKAVVAETPTPTPDARPAGRPAKIDEPPPTENGGTLPSLQAPTPTVDLKKDDLMTQASKAYDGGEFDEAMTLARKVLEDDPQNTRMRRIMVSSSCILDDAATAQKNYLFLPVQDRETMRIRCARYGVTFTES
ncbi:MAG TPA: hypothetical protein VGM90_28235 [Kofleriaceae bacterium]